MSRVGVALIIAACTAEPTPRPRDAELHAIKSATSAERVGLRGPIRMETLYDEELPPTFIMRGEPRGNARIVFLHGMCGHGLGYAQAFQFSASKKGWLIAPQGDVLCGKGPWAKWSKDLVTLDARIESAFRAVGLDGPLEDVLVIGYSQGATRAEELARKWPERYTRLILMGAPQVASPRGLGHLRGAVLMAGERDRKDLMRAGMQSLKRAGIPATFQIIPEATHGAMGPVPEKTMGEALDWLWENERDPADKARASQTPGLRADTNQVLEGAHTPSLPRTN
jgi:pimeloyl-ACP methyl ester carboxylesterase